MLYNHLKQIALRQSDKQAVIAGEQQLSYQALIEQIDAVAVELQSLGVSAGDAVGLLLPNSPEFVIATFAVLALDAVAVPVNTRFQAEEINYYLGTSQVSVVLYNEAAAPLLAAISDKVRRCKIVLGQSRNKVVLNVSQRTAEDAASLPAIHMYSSGSTGKAKRVTRTQGNLLAEYKALAATIELTEQDRILCTVPLYHAHGFANCLFAALFSGGTLVLMQGEFNPREATRLLAEYKITIYPAVPFMFKMMADAFYPAPPDMSSVRLFFSAGAPLPLEVTQKFQSRFGVTLRQLYGSTETGALSINLDNTPGTEESVGKPLRGISITILDEDRQLVPDGEIGEIAIRSPAMTTKYDGLADMTAECFADGYFLPGDLASKDAQGQIYIKGRKKLLIIVAGNKVDPLDVESVIKTHHKVQDVVVLGQAHPNYGEMVKAVVVADAGVNQEEIIALCAQHLAEYKVPKIVEFRAEIPRSPLGKILRKYL